MDIGMPLHELTIEVLDPAIAGDDGDGLMEEEPRDEDGHPRPD